MIELEINQLSKIITNGSKGSWKSSWAESRKWHRLIAEALIEKNIRLIEPMQKAQLTLIRHSSNEPDFDGLVSSFKHVIDGLVRAGIIANDKISNIGQPQYRWEKARPNHGKIQIRVEECV